MPFLRLLVEGEGDARLNPAGVVVGQADRLGDGIGGFKANAPNVLHHLVRGFANDPQRIIPVFFVDFGCEGGGNGVRLQKQHHFFDRLLLLPRLDDPVNPFAADADHVGQPLRLLFDDVKRIRTKLVDDAFGHHFAHTLNQAGPQITFDPFRSGRQRLTGLFSSKLAAVFGVGLPSAVDFQPFSGVDIRQMSGDGDQRFPAAGILIRKHLPSIRLEPNHGIPVLFIIEGDAFDGAADAGWITHEKVQRRETRDERRETTDHRHQTLETSP